MEQHIINQLSHNADHDSKEPPKIFWKFYDQYRRGKITIDDFMKLSGLPIRLLSSYLRNI